MTIGALPLLAFRSTSHFQVIAPFEFATFGSSPAAVELPDLYCTSMPHSAPFVVLIDTDALAFRATLAVRFVSFTGRSNTTSGGSVGWNLVARGSAAAGTAVSPRTSPSVEPPSAPPQPARRRATTSSRFIATSLRAAQTACPLIRQSRERL